MSDSSYGVVEHQLVPGVLRGYRQWGLHHECSLPAEYRLVAMGGSLTTWYTGINKAHCLLVGMAIKSGCLCDGCCSGRAPHQSPANWCSCGFYGLHQPNWQYPDNGSQVTGSIKASGRVILGTKGFRAEYAEVEALVTSSAGLAEQLGRHYKVPVYSQEDALLEAFPPIPVDELLGPPAPPFFPDWVQRTATMATMTLTPEQLRAFEEAVGLIMGRDIEEEQ